jgi:thiamine-phosphate pyrophosphorylase
MRDVREGLRGLYAIADAEASGGDPVRIGAAALHGGCRLVQLRCKGWPADDVARAAIDLVGRCHAVGAWLIVNDDPRIAAESGADGVHLGQLDGPIADARRVLPAGAIVGRSTGDLDALRLAMTEADYVAFGPIWDTPHLSRPKPVRGLDRLRQARAVVTGVPLVAIGGVTAARVPELRAVGVDAWAVIGAISGAADPVAATRELL